MKKDNTEIFHASTASVHTNQPLGFSRYMHTKAVWVYMHSLPRSHSMVTSGIRRIVRAHVPLRQSCWAPSMHHCNVWNRALWWLYTRHPMTVRACVKQPIITRSWLLWMEHAENYYTGGDKRLLLGIHVGPFIKRWASEWSHPVMKNSKRWQSLDTASL